MALPAENTPWPPAQHAARYDKMRTNSIWYEGDPDKLANTYKGGHIETADAGVEGGFKSKIYTIVHRWFWGTGPGAGQKDSKIHVPLAEDIAVMSSELLFAEPPLVRLDIPKIEKPKDPPKPSPITGTLPPDPITGVAPPPEAVGQAPTDPITGEVETETIDDPAGVEAQETLEWILDRVGWQALLLAAAETQSPLGSVALRIAWDKDVDAKAPFLTRVDADATIPEYRWGKLVAVTFWTAIRNDKTKVVRFLERYSPGKVEYAVYEGSHDNLGKIKPLTDYPETAWVAENPQLVGDTIEYPALQGLLLATSIPNRLPDPSDRQAAVGRSDYSPGTLTLFDAVDEIASSLMRDIALGKGRVFVARYMLEDQGPGKGAAFNPDQDYFSPVRANPSDKDEMPLVASQFAIRVEEHIKAIEWYSAKAIRSAGFNPDSDFGEQGGDMTATEYSGRTRRSFSTRAKKALYWTTALEGIVEALIRVFNAEFAGQEGNAKAIPEDWPVIVEFPPAAHPDIKYLAETANTLKQAQAASTRVRVQLVHPDWTDLEVDEEVARIEEEGEVVDPATFGLAPDLGTGAEPEITTPSPFEEQA